jgi:hypothetical protein
MGDPGENRGALAAAREFFGQLQALESESAAGACPPAPVPAAPVPAPDAAAPRAAFCDLTRCAG